MWRRRATCEVLVVCTGNVCRSPYVAARLQGALPALAVASAGTNALVGSLPTEQVHALLAERGITPVPTVARVLRPWMVREARLVITATGVHRARALEMTRSASEHCFTLLELARVLRAAGSPTGLGADGVVELAGRAVAVDSGRDHDDDLADPYGRSEAHYDRMAAAADEALAVLGAALRGGP